MLRFRVLSLYKQLLRNGDNLLYTDKDYYRNRIREQFYRNRNVKQESHILRLIQIAERLIREKRIR